MTASEFTRGIRENRIQVAHQLIQVMLVGFAIGMTRTVVPALAESEFGLERGSFLLLASFVVAFGAVKAVMNFVAGRWSERMPRSPRRRLTTSRPIPRTRRSSGSPPRPATTPRRTRGRSAPPTLHVVSPPFLRLSTSQSGTTLERRMPRDRPLTQSAHTAIMGSYENGFGHRRPGTRAANADLPSHRREISA